MNQGVEILLSRMDSNPEEFADEFFEGGVYQRRLDKWEWLLDALKCKRMEDRKAALPYLTHQEIEMLFNKYQELQRELFTKRVMGILLGQAEEPSVGFKPGFGTGFDAAPIKAEGAPIQYERKIKLSKSQMELVRKLGETK